MIHEDEIVKGLVLHLCPDTLAENGGTYTCGPDQRVRDGHFFICITTDSGSTSWLPLYSNEGVGRTKVPMNDRTGHPKWTTGTFYWHQDQVWHAPHSAVIAAAVAGKDKSSRTKRNMIEESALPRIDTASD